MINAYFAAQPIVDELVHIRILSPEYPRITMDWSPELEANNWALVLAVKFERTDNLSACCMFLDRIRHLLK
jgi:hypothetical protein